MLIVIVLAVLLLIALGAVCVLVLAKADLVHELLSVKKRRDELEMEVSRQRVAAQDVVPYLAKTSVDMFYGAQEGVQYSFAERQEITRRVQKQNAALRHFNEIFGVTVTSEMMARAGVGDPESKAAVQEMLRIEELGRNADLPPVEMNPWRG